MKRYEAYDSFLDIWVDEIPSHWETHKMKYLFHERSEKGYPDEPLLVASQNMGVVPKNVYGNRTVEAQKDLHLLKLVRVGDFVISLRSFQGGLEYAYYQGIISPAYTVLTPHEPITAGYFRYLAKSKLFIGLLTLCVTGIREGQNIDYEKLRNHLLPVPPREEQDQIVRYLDWQVSKINQLIAAKRKQIELINEQQQCIINKAILQGISNGKRISIHTKEWFGAIPSNWHTQRIKYLFQLRDERSYLPLEDVNLISLYSKLGVVQNKDIEYTSGNKARNADGYKKVFYDDIVVNIILCWMGAIGRSAYNGVTSPAYDVYQPQKGTCSKYYHYLFRLKAFGDECYKVGKGIMTMRWRVYSDQFCNIIVPVPPLDEQEHIVKWLDERLTAYRKNILMIEKEISCLHELRTRLISDVVTGQVDVRGIEVPEFEMVNEIDTEEPVEEENEQIE